VTLLSPDILWGLAGLAANIAAAAWLHYCFGWGFLRVVYAFSAPSALAAAIALTLAWRMGNWPLWATAVAVGFGVAGIIGILAGRLRIAAEGESAE
jgi:hypothetical protein